MFMQPLMADMVIDSIIIEQTKSNQAIVDSWRQSIVDNISQDDIIHISGLEIGMEAGEFEWRKAEEALRATRLFRKIRIEIDTLDARNVTVYIIHELALPEEGPSLSAEVGGSIASLGGIFSTKNLSGSLIDLQAHALNRTEHGIGPALNLTGTWNNAMQSRVSIGFGFHYHRFTQGLRANASIAPHPMGGLFFGASLQSQEGIDFLFENATTQRVSQNQQEYSVWGGWLLPRKDNLYFTVKATINEAERGLPKTIQAFDNTRSLLLGFGSLADRTRISNGEEIPIGAWGTAVLGRIMPFSQRGVESYYYVGGEVEQSELTLNNRLYLRGRISAGTGLLQGSALNTAFLANVQTQFMVSKDAFLALNVHTNATWNWNDFRQIILDNSTGVRGIPINSIIGNNRMIANVIAVKDFFPLFLGMRLGITAFADIGSVWNRGMLISNTSWNSSIGGGILILAEGRSLQVGKPLLRIEYAHVLQGGNGIVLATDYPFTLFTTHQYSAPTIISKEIDIE
ncbi:MAG: hypothetical protein ACO30P_06600 [Candidatus Kapaibacteriota bacterium]